MKPAPSQLQRAQLNIEKRQITIEDYLATVPPAARGSTYEPEDTHRLNAQGLDVYHYCRDLRAHTLAEISAGTGHPEASVSARLREIRRYLHEGNKGTVLRERVPGKNGLHTYAIRLNKYPSAA